MLVAAQARPATCCSAGPTTFSSREFSDSATDEQKLSLLRCLFAVSAVEGNISIGEEREV